MYAAHSSPGKRSCAELNASTTGETHRMRVESATLDPPRQVRPCRDTNVMPHRTGRERERREWMKMAEHRIGCDENPQRNALRRSEFERELDEFEAHLER